MFYRLFLISFILLNATSLKSAYIENMPQSLTQPDKTILNCFSTGDEFFNWLHDAAGYTIMQNQSTGWYVYADLVNDIFVPTTLIPGKSEPSTAGLKPWLIYSEQKLRSFRDKFKVPEIYNKIQKKNEQLQSSANRGVLNNLAIFIRFADEVAFTQNTTYFDTPYNSKSNISVYNYYYEVSYNQLEIKTNFYPQPNGQIVLSYQDNYPRSYYKVYNSVTAPDGYKNDNERTIREMTLIKKAVEYVSQNIPTDVDFDMDNDGYIDNVAFIVTGGPEGWADLIWPHMWALYYYDVQINGARVWNFNFLMANWFDSSVLCHEMFHTLGAPDLYRYYVSGSPVGTWDIMSNNAYPPQYTSMFMRWKYGNWIDEIPEVTKSGVYELNPSSMKEGSVLKVQSRYNTGEYFVLEYRKKEGRYDVSIPKSGLLVWRINTQYDGNAGGPPDGVYVYRSNGTKSSWGNLNDAPFAEEYGKVKFNDYSTNPQPFLTAGGKGGLNLSNIGKIEGTIKFRINFPPKVPNLISPVNNTVVAPVNPVFEWEPAEDADYYSFEISYDANFTNVLYSQNNISTTSLVLPFELSNVITYYWRVKSFSNYEEESNWSVASIFTVTPEKPVITGNTPSQIICANDDFNLFIETKGSVIQFQWYKDGNPIEGATYAILKKINAGFSNSATYVCRITNFPGIDTLYSEDISVYVSTSTEFIKQPETQYAANGGNIDFTFRVHVNGKIDNYYTDVKWFKNDVVLNDGPRFSGTKSDILNINFIQNDDFGAKYKVEVTGRCGTVLSSNEFTIIKMPETIIRTLETSICSDKDNLLDLGFESQVPPGYELKVSTSGNIVPMIEIIDGNYFLNILQSEVPDGKYNISAEFYLEPSGYVIETVNYDITLQSAPKLIVDLPDELRIRENDLFEISLKIDGNNFKSDWYQNGIIVVENIDNMDKLTVDFATLDLTGEWQIRFYNDCGEVWTNTCVVTVIPKNDQPTDISDEFASNTVSVYPNPVNNQLNLIFDVSMDVHTAEIIDIFGNKIVQSTIPQNSGSYKFDLSKFNLANGTYFVILKSDNDLKTVKFNIVK